MLIDRPKRGRADASTAGPAALVAAWLLLAMALPAEFARAVEVTDLYTVEVPLEAGEPNAQTNAYRDALIEVLIRVTGTTAAAESEELAALFPNAARFVTQYRPGPDGSLIVTLDGPAIERILRQSGATVWGPDRPLTIVWLAVDWGLGDREIVAAGDAERSPADLRTIDRNRLLREQVETVARRRGLPVLFPLLDAEDLRNIGFSDVWGGFDVPLIEASARYDAPSVLVGRIRPDDLQPPRWTWYVGEQRFAWPGEPEVAIDQLADAMAARDAVRGDREIERIELTISGVNSVVAYGEVQRLMENLRVVERLAIKSVSSDRIVYEVDVTGGVERLNNVLQLNELLERVDNDYFFGGSLGVGPPQPELPSVEYRYRQAMPESLPLLQQDDRPEMIPDD